MERTGSSLNKEFTTAIHLEGEVRIDSLLHAVIRKLRWAQQQDPTDFPDSGEYSNSGRL